MAFGRRGGGRVADRFPITWREMVAERPAYDAWVGRSVRRPFDDQGGGDVVTIGTQTSWYVRERGIEQGFPEDQGWVVEVRARTATETEKALFAVAEAKLRGQRGEVV